MATLLEFKNPFKILNNPSLSPVGKRVMNTNFAEEIANDPDTSIFRLNVASGKKTLLEFLHDVHGKTKPLFPAVCCVNGKLMWKKDWENYQVHSDDEIAMIAVVGDGYAIFSIVIALISITVSVIAMANMQDIPKEIDSGEPDTAFSLKGQHNQIRLSYPIEVPYGRCRLYPSYAARAYNLFEDNEQYLFQLLCLGQGEYDVESILIDETPIGNFPEIEYEVYVPNEDVTMFPDNVITSTEVSNLILYGPNQSEYTGASGPFVTSGANRLSHRIEYDITFPQGLGYLNDYGTYDAIGVRYLLEYCLIDNNGQEIGTWQTAKEETYTAATPNPIRFTVGVDVPDGRYAVRGQRLTNYDDRTRALNRLVWASVRVYQKDVKSYGDVTLLAIKSRATNNLNDSSSNRINVWATRKLKTWDSTSKTWTAPVATRSPVWAFCDVITAKYASNLSENYLSLPALSELDTKLKSLGVNFDHVFDTSSGVWDALKLIANIARAVPVVTGSQLSLSRDDTRAVSSMLFSPDNIVRRSVNWEIKLPQTGDYDSVIVQYKSASDWKDETVTCSFDGKSDYPQTVQLYGCTDRNKAYQYGMYLISQWKYQRQKFTWDTGREGNLPNFNSLVTLAHPLPRWGSKNGFVDSVTSDDSGVLLNLTFKVSFDDPEASYYIALRSKAGTERGPYKVNSTDVANIVRIASEDVGDFNADDYFFDDVFERPIAIFGSDSSVGKKLIVTGIEPNGDTVRLIGVPYDERVFAYQHSVAPGDDVDPVDPPAPIYPIVDTIQVYGVPGDEVNNSIIAWSAAAGATVYDLEMSTDNVKWTRLLTQTNATTYTLATGTSRYVYIRVRGEGTYVGPWKNWEGQVGVDELIPPDVRNLRVLENFEGHALKLEWDLVYDADSYSVTLTTGFGTKTYTTSGTSFELEGLQAQEDELCPPIETNGENVVPRPSLSVNVSIVAVNEHGQSANATSVVATRHAPPPVLSLYNEHDDSLEYVRFIWTWSSGWQWSTRVPVSAVTRMLFFNPFTGDALGGAWWMPDDPNYYSVPQAGLTRAFRSRWHYERKVRLTVWNVDDWNCVTETPLQTEAWGLRGIND
jgi:hypothetical protein